MKTIKAPITRDELAQIAKEEYGDMVKAVVDINQEIMAVGAGMHAEEEDLLIRQEGSERENTWGINIYFQRAPEEWIEFDSMVNLKPAQGNRTRGVDAKDIRARIATIVRKLIKDS